MNKATVLAKKSLESAGDDGRMAELFMEVSPGQSVLLVEGDTEVRALSYHINAEWSLLDCNGRENVFGMVKEISSASLEKLQRITGRNSLKYLALIDRDFDQCTFSFPVFATEEHDFEIAVLSTGALEKLLKTTGTFIKINNLTITKGHGSVFGLLLNLGSHLGTLRFNKQVGAAKHLHFKDSFASDFLDSSSWNVDLASLYTASCALPGDYTPPTNISLERLCNGHDLIRILTRLIKKHKASSASGAGEVSNLLISSIEVSHLKMMSFYEGLQSASIELGAPLFKQ